MEPGALLNLKNNLLPSSQSIDEAVLLMRTRFTASQRLACPNCVVLLADGEGGGLRPLAALPLPPCQLLTSPCLCVCAPGPMLRCQPLTASRPTPSCPSRPCSSL